LAYFSQKGRQNYAFTFAKSTPKEKNMAVFSKDAPLSDEFHAFLGCHHPKTLYLSPLKQLSSFFSRLQLWYYF
jgi:hypothetical protein